MSDISYGVEVEDVYHITGDGVEPSTRISRELSAMTSKGIMER